MTQYQCSSRYLGKIIKPLLLWLILIYILLQMSVLFNHSGSVKSLTSFSVKKTSALSKVNEFNPQTTSAARAEVVTLKVTKVEKKPQFVTQMVNIKNEDYSQLSSGMCGSDVRLLRGVPRKKKGFLTIGLTTVPRIKENYLPGTLQSLIEKLQPEEKEKIVIVLFIGSLDESFTNSTLKLIDSTFSEPVTSGLLQVIQPQPYVYPDFSQITKRTFNDSLDRVHWRTKQNIDFAAMFSYCEHLSEYYIHVEDDVIAANGYIADIKDLLDRVNSPTYKNTWFELDFSTLGFIGRLYRSSDLCLIKKFLLLFVIEKPCDILLNDLKHVMMQPKDIRSRKSLFQHVGKTSSLKGKIQNLTDRTFKDLRRPAWPVQRGRGNVIERDLSVSFKHSQVPNPMPSKIVTTNMETFGDYKPERGYFSFEKGFYWAKAPSMNSSYRVEYNVTTRVDSITIRTGHPKKFIDMLEKGSVRVSLGNTSRGPDDCGKFTDIGNFDKGQFYVHFNSTMDVKCFDIVVTESMKTWLIIAEISVDTDNESGDDNAEDYGSKGQDKEKTKR